MVVLYTNIKQILNRWNIWAQVYKYVLKIWNHAAAYSSKTPSRCFKYHNSQMSPKKQWKKIKEGLQSSVHLHGVVYHRITKKNLGKWDSIWWKTFTIKNCADFTERAVRLWVVDTFHWCFHLSASETRYNAVCCWRKYQQMNPTWLYHFAAQSWWVLSDPESQKLLSEEFLSQRNIDTWKMKQKVLTSRKL